MSIYPLIEILRSHPSPSNLAGSTFEHGFRISGVGVQVALKSQGSYTVRRWVFDRGVVEMLSRGSILEISGALFFFLLSSDPLLNFLADFSGGSDCT